VTVKATKVAMVMATRVAGNEDGDGDGNGAVMGDGNGDEGGGRATPRDETSCEQFLPPVCSKTAAKGYSLCLQKKRCIGVFRLD
jgi:hypothetical protein